MKHRFIWHLTWRCYNDAGNDAPVTYIDRVEEASAEWDRFLIVHGHARIDLACYRIEDGRLRIPISIWWSAVELLDSQFHILIGYPSIYMHIYWVKTRVYNFTQSDWGRSVIFHSFIPLSDSTVDASQFRANRIIWLTQKTVIKPHLFVFLCSESKSKSRSSSA